MGRGEEPRGKVTAGKVQSEPDPGVCGSDHTTELLGAPDELGGSLLHPHVSIDCRLLW